MTTTQLIEVSTLDTTGPSTDGTWRVRLISEGEGSSGVYSRELLENYGHVFEGSLSYRNHPTEGQSVTDRDFTMISGRLVGSIDVVQEDDGRTALYGNYLPDPDYAEKLERYKDALGLSIFAAGGIDADRNVTHFEADDPFRSVDVVIAPGARGRFLQESVQKFLEGAREGDPSDKPGVNAAQEGKETMEIAELAAKVDALAEQMTTLVSVITEQSDRAAEVEVNEAAVEEALSAFESRVALVNEAQDITASQRTSLIAEAKAGKDVEPLIEAAQAVTKEIRESLGAAEGAGEGRMHLTETATTYGAYA